MIIAVLFVIILVLIILCFYNIKLYGIDKFQSYRLDELVHYKYDTKNLHKHKRNYFQQADLDKNQYLSKQEIKNMLGIDNARIEEGLKKYDIDGNKQLSMNEFMVM